MSAPTTPSGAGGVLLLDKPAGWTSTRALGRCKRLLGLRKGGHTGTLDPFATGLLPLVFGEATKFSRFLIDAPKAYIATLCLGRTSTTGDPEGEISAQQPHSVESSKIDDVLALFVGVQLQVPPMHSAVHHEGRRLYELAREGVEVDREPRTVEVNSIERLGFDADKLLISVKCSKGTYIRTLAQDIGARLGCGAYLTDLRRTEVAGFDIGQAVTLEQLEAAGREAGAKLLPPEVMVRSLPRLDLDEPSTRAIEQGRQVHRVGLEGGEVALHAPGGRFLGVGLSDGAGRLSALRLLATGPTRAP